MFEEFKARVKYDLLCLLAVDGSWDIGAYRLPFTDGWFNEFGYFPTLKEANDARESNKLLAEKGNGL